MDEFTNLKNMDLDILSNEVLQSFGERYMEDATRVLLTGCLLPRDNVMVQLALAITLGMYSKKLVEGNFKNERTVVH